MPQLHFVLPGDPASATGGYQYDRQMIAGLRRQGWQVQLHCLDGSFPQPSAAALDEAGRLLADLPADAWVLIDGLALGAMPQVVAAHARRLRLMALVHHPLADETGLTSVQAQQLFRAEQQALQAVRFVVTTGPAMVNALQRYVGDAQRIGMAPPGIDKPAAITRHAHDDRVQLICVATITARKGHEILVEALAGVSGLPWRLECVGDMTRSPGTLRALQQRIAAAGLQSRVTFSGVVDEAALQARLQQADVFVLATQFEGYGMAVAEALAHGLPVISTHTGEIESLVGADAGLIVPVGDVMALRAALSTVVGDPAVRSRLSAAAVLRAAALPDWDAASHQLSRLLIRGAGLSAIGEAA